MLRLNSELDFDGGAVSLYAVSSITGDSKLVGSDDVEVLEFDKQPPSAKQEAWAKGSVLFFKRDPQL